MKKISILFILVFTSLQICSARETTYHFATGWRQLYTNAFLDKTTKTPRAETQVNGLEVTYGIAKDMHAGVAFGFLRNFHAALLGPEFRYDIHRLFDRNEETWKYLHLFLEAKFLAKFGGEIKSGITFHAPYLGVEILPFSNVNFAILSSGGLVIDMVEKSYIGFTNSMFGDVGIRYYF